jgi:heat-inducible transcriptional repressor
MVQGLTIQGAKEKLFSRMQAEKSEYDTLFSRFVDFSRRVFEYDRDAEVMIDGTLNLLDHPEFADFDRMKALFRAFEEKSSIIRLLDDALLGEPIHVVIGKENQCMELQCCSLIMAGYGRPGQAMGRIGIIGPTRMEYARIIPLVKYTAGVISELLAEC